MRRSLGGAVGFTLVQQAAYFASAALLVQGFGAALFGAFGQALALAGLLASAGTARLELAGQLADDEDRSAALCAMASRLALVVGLFAVAGAALAWAVGGAAAWWLAGALALAPLAWVQVAASRAVRAGQVVRAAAWRAGPAVAMLALQATAWALTSPALALASLPAGAALGALLVGRQAWPRPRTRRPGPPWAGQGAFVRAELPAFLLNAVSLQGQVLLVGALAGDAAAGVFALAQRIAFAPTSLFGPALTDWLRARTIGLPAGAAVRRLVARALAAMAALSLLVHAALVALMPLLADTAFAGAGAELVPVTRLLALVGALRLMTSPLTFVLPMRGWYAHNLGGQAALFTVATLATLAGIAGGGLVAVAELYLLGSGVVYLLYLHWSWRAFGLPPRSR